MPLLQVRDFPDDLYETLSRAARHDHRSIAQETVVLIKQALGQRESRTARRKAVVEDIKSLSIKNSDSFPAPAGLIREDRDR